MAMNPMQRKIRNSFLLGFLVAIIIAAIIVVLLFLKIKGLQDEIVSIQTKENAAVTQVYVLSSDAKAGQTLAGDENGDGAIIETVSLPTQLVPQNALTTSTLEEFRNDDGALEITAKIDLSAGAILTAQMVENGKETGTFRQVEYTMISLPSQLAEGDYIDIRLKGPTGESLVVISKIKVDATDASSIWLTVSEAQLMLLNNAIVESYIIDGVSLYATRFTNPVQPALAQTYTPNELVTELIGMIEDGGIASETDKQILATGNVSRDYLEGLLSKYTEEEKIDKVEEGYTAEETTIQAARESLLGDLGY